MIIFVTLKQVQRDYEADLVEVLGTFHTLNQAQAAAHADAGPDLLNEWVEIGSHHEAEAKDFSTIYSVTKHKVPKAEFAA